MKNAYLASILAALWCLFMGLGNPGLLLAQPSDPLARKPTSHCCKFHLVGLEKEHIDFLRNFADEESARIREKLGLSEKGEAIDVYITGTMKNFGIGTQKRSPLPWVAGVADPKLRSIALHLSHFTVEELQVTLSHELAHIYVWERSQGKRMPRWFEEGIAMWLAREPTLRHLKTVVESYPTEALPELKEITRSFPRETLAAHRAYATSYSFLRWSMDHRREKNVPQRILKLVALGTSFPKAFETVLGQSPEQLEARWKSTLSRGLWIPLVIHLSDLLWIFCALLVVIGGWKVWGRPREPEDPEDDLLDHGHVLIPEIAAFKVDIGDEDSERSEDSEKTQDKPPRFLH